MGFAEIRMRDDAPGAQDVKVSEIIKMPTDLLSTVGTSSEDRPLVLLMNRERVIPVPPRNDPEESMARQFTLPTTRSFGVGGEARLSPFLPDSDIDHLLGYDGPVVADSSAHLSGAPQDRASAALDQDPATAWVTPFEHVAGQHVDVHVPEPITLDHLDLQVVADGRHSVPVQLSITSDGGTPVVVDVPPVTDQAAANAAVAAPVTFPAITGKDFRIKIVAVRDVTTREWYCECDLADAGRDSGARHGRRSRRFASATVIPDECRNDLITIDDQAVPTRVVGSTADALALKPLALVSCSDGSVLIASTGAGTHVLRTQAGNRAGFDVDRLTLASQPGGAAWTDMDAQGGLLNAGDPTVAAAAAEPAPAIKVLEVRTLEDEGAGHRGDQAVLARARAEQQPRLAGDRRWQGPRRLDARRRLWQRLADPTGEERRGVRRLDGVGPTADGEPRDCAVADQRRRVHLDRAGVHGDPPPAPTQR